MPDRVTFRERAAGVCVEGDLISFGGLKPISIVEPRVKFVKGWISVDNDPVNGTEDPEDGSVEVGDDTPFPLKANLEQVFEVMYRVKDAKFTQGKGTIIPEFGDPVEYTATYVGFSDVALTDNFYETSSSSSTQRSYCARASGKPSESFSEVYKDEYYDAISELGMWHRPGFSDSDFSWEEAFSDVPFVCGFTHDTYPLDDAAISSAYMFYETDDGVNNIGTANRATVRLSGEVAYVGADDPYSPDAELYINCEFLMSGYYSENFGENYGGTLSLESGGSDFGLKFALELSGNVKLECKLFTKVWSEGDQDFVLSATKWWPYAKLDNSPAWDEDTGEPIGDISA